MRNKKEKELILKYLNNNCSEEEFEQVLKLFKDEELVNDIMHEIWEEGSFVFDENNSNALNSWNKVYSKLETVKQISHKKSRKVYLSLLRVASVILLVVVNIWLFNYVVSRNDKMDHIQALTSENGKNKQSILILSDGERIILDSLDQNIMYNLTGTQVLISEDTIDNHINRVKGEVDYNQIIIPKGKRHNIILSDGTKVWLNSNSVFRYPAYFGDDHRTVYLEGEGYFEVKKDKNKLFTVITADVDIEVLGTSFDVCSYKTDSYSKTVLVEGSVKVKRKNQGILKKDEEIILAPDELIEFRRNSRDFYKEEIDSELYTSWKDGKLIFKNTMLKEVAERMSRWYGVKINIAKNLTHKYNFTFTVTDETLKEELEKMTKAAPIYYSIDNETVYIFEKILLN